MRDSDHVVRDKNDPCYCCYPMYHDCSGCKHEHTESSWTTIKQSLRDDPPRLGQKNRRKIRYGRIIKSDKR